MMIMKKSITTPVMAMQTKTFHNIPLLLGSTDTPHMRHPMMLTRYKFPCSTTQSLLQMFIEQIINLSVVSVMKVQKHARQHRQSSLLSKIKMIITSPSIIQINTLHYFVTFSAELSCCSLILLCFVYFNI